VSSRQRASELAARSRDRVEDLVVERVALGRVVDREPRDVRPAVERSLPPASSRYSRTTRVSPSRPTGPPRRGSRDGALVLGLDGHLHLHRLEDHDGVALLDVSPTSTSIFHTVPVMWASTFATADSSFGPGARIA
jgi:hypothetical protein